MERKLSPVTRVLGRQDYPLRDQVRDELRKQIIHGQLKPGQRLVEQALADEFGVSRIPVREALRMLEAEGIVSVAPRVGAMVSALTRSDLEYLYEVRTALEVQVFRLAAERATPQDIQRLQQLMEQARLAANTGDHADNIKINIEFHEMVTEIVGNPFLSSMLEPLNSRLGLLFGQSHEHERQLTEHTGLVEAIADRDGERAAAAALAHIRTSRAHALDQYDSEHSADTA